jgi:peptidoglycan hydrolase CwlO-like protein
MDIDQRQSRLEQVMTALAEAQVKTEDQIARLEAAQAGTDAKVGQLADTMNALAGHVATLAQAQLKTELQFQAYLTTHKN